MDIVDQGAGPNPLERSAMEGLLEAEKLLPVAMELELTGETFYEVVSSACGRDRPAVERLFLRLAEEEREHYRPFEKMLRELPAKTDRPTAALSQEQRNNVVMLLSERVLPDPAAARDKAACCSLREALDIAMEMERRSIAFYRSILPAVANPRDADVLQRIIAEERTHETDLATTRRHTPR
jgi:rubrerythrin